MADAAQILSIAESVVATPLDPSDLIDTCRWLCEKYGSIEAVAALTGLSPEEISEYVKRGTPSA